MYIHQSTCISAQNTFTDINLEKLMPVEQNVLKIIEPKYENIPLNILRRMGKAVRMGVGSALPLTIQNEKIEGIILGTANGGMEDCIKFLNQLIQYREGTLTPTNFVQSTPNAIAAQVGLISHNHGYNITHVHRGLAFENALIDAKMLLLENPDSTYIVGGLDEISTYNYNIERLGTAYKEEEIQNMDLYECHTPGTIAGEGAAMFLLNNRKDDASAKISAIHTVTTDNPNEIEERLKQFMIVHSIIPENLSLLLSGENGDSRLSVFYEKVESLLGAYVPVARFKHFFGEFPTASAPGLWLASQFLIRQYVPKHFLKPGRPEPKNISNILIYNTYKGNQHSFIYLQSV